MAAQTRFDEPYSASDVNTDLSIAVIGCGGTMGGAHTRAHARAGRDVVALCDVDEESMEECREAFFPEADCYTDYREVIERDDVDIVDLPVHPETREAMLEDALEAGKHVYSEKPFVVDLAVGERLIDLADEQGVKIAVNQSKRWNTASATILNAAERGVIGDPMAVHVGARRNKDPVPAIKGASEYWALYNFGVHYFDFVVTLMDGRPDRVSATATRSSIQESEIPLVAQVAADYGDAQASLRFDLNTPYGGADRNYVIGTEGTMKSTRKGPEGTRVTLSDADGTREPPTPDTEDGWFGEFVAAIEEDREPLHSARNNLRTLELVFAAVASADDDGRSKVPGEVRKLPDNTIRDHLRLR